MYNTAQCFFHILFKRSSTFIHCYYYCYTAVTAYTVYVMRAIRIWSIIRDDNDKNTWYLNNKIYDHRIAGSMRDDHNNIMDLERNIRHAKGKNDNFFSFK